MPALQRTTIVAARRASVVVERKPIRDSAFHRPHSVSPTFQTPERTLRAKLDELASRVRRLTISRSDPERFFEDRSEIAAELLKLAGALP